MKNKFFKTLIINFFMTFGVGILGFIINKYFAMYMGVNMLGLMKLFTQMIAYLSLAELGLANASTYALYKPLAENDIFRINTIISTISSFYKKIALIVLICGIGISFLIPNLINSTQYGIAIYFYWILYVTNTAISYIFAKYPVLFTANQEYGVVRIIQGSGKIIFQFLQILILIKIQSFTLFIFMMILENLYTYCFYRKYYKKNYNFLKTVKNREKSILKDMKNLFWHQIGGIVVYNTDYIVLSKFTTLSVVGVYSSYLMIYQMAVTIINIPTSVLRPIIGDFVTRNKKEEIYNRWRELYRLYFIAGTVLVISIYILIIPFIKLWLGEKFILPKLTITLILLNLFIQLVRGATDIFKDSCGFFDDTQTPILESVINLIISLVLVRKIGLDGVIIGTLASNISIIFLWRPILVFKRCFEKNPLDYIKDLIKLIVLSVLSIFIILKLLKVLNIYTVEIKLWRDLLYQSFIIGILVVLVVFIVFLLDKNFREFLRKNIFLKMIKNKKHFIYKEISK